MVCIAETWKGDVCVCVHDVRAPHLCPYEAGIIKASEFQFFYV